MKIWPDCAENDQDPKPTVRDMPPPSRRDFIMRGAAMLVMGSASTSLHLALANAPNDPAAHALFSEKQQKNLSAVQAHLLPTAADAPGALDINALPYLQFVMSQADFEADTRDFVFRGLQSLHEAGMERFEREFHQLDFAQKETLLRYLADRTRWGQNWLSLILKYLMEALLTDPVYGGNPGGMGWQWLQYQAGFPRPPADKTYTQLQSRATAKALPTPSRTRRGF